MSVYDWEEVKRLAADFQKTQFSSISQKLSERNWVEIITKLTQLKLLNVFFTNDGKTYVTPKYLIREIKNELDIHNGRISLIDIAKSLNVDLNIVLSLTHEIIKENTGIKNILGQLINHTYLLYLAEEINDRLQQHGFINITELARTFDLPVDFIHSIIKENYGRIIRIKQDKQDSQIYYTESYLSQSKALVRGALVAIIKPTLISTVINHCGGIKEKVFFSLIDNLVESKQIPGIVTERCGNLCTYIPQIYLKTQSEWINSFYNQNKYLEYDTLSRAGINDPKTFIAKSLNCKEDLQYLRNCVIGQHLIDQIEVSIDEIMISHTWINILNILPSAIDIEDAEMVLKNVLSKFKNLSNVQIFNRTYAVSTSFLNKINSRINEKIIPKNINEAINLGSYEQYLIESKINITSDSDKQELSRKEERKKRANIGKSGGGIQGRETKTKTIKKKYIHKNISKVEPDEENFVKPKGHSYFELVSSDEIRNEVLSDESFQDEEIDNSEFVQEIVHYLYLLVNKAALSLAQTMYEERIANINNSRKKMNAELQDNIISSYQDLKLYYKGIKEFTNENLQISLNKYLLKTTGAQLVNTCFTLINDKNEEICSPELRQKVLSNIENKKLKESFSKLVKGLNGNSVDEFICFVEDALCTLNIMIKKIDKKKEKLFLESHKRALVEKLKETDNPPLILHLISLILFQTVTHNMLNASGKFVSSILNLLEKRLPLEVFEILQRYHFLVLKIFKLNENDEDYEKINDKLNEITPSIKQLVFSITN